MLMRVQPEASAPYPNAKDASALRVTIEAQDTVGEDDIVIL